jgi:hypothetical protein
MNIILRTKKTESCNNFIKKIKLSIIFNNKYQQFHL